MANYALKFRVFANYIPKFANYTLKIIQAQQFVN